MIIMIIFVFDKTYNQMITEEFNELTHEEKSLYVYLEDNINDVLVGEITKEELIKTLFTKLKFKND